MASIIGKTIKGQTYYYLREVARVGGKPKVVSQRYLGKAADIEAAVAGAVADHGKCRWTITENVGRLSGLEGWGDGRSAAGDHLLAEELGDGDGFVAVRA